MVNNTMTQQQDSNPPQPVQPAAKPNESTGLNIDEHVKIFDPNSATVILEKRA